MIDYALLKLVHMTCAGANYALFFARGVLMLRASPLLRARWVKVIPHVVDTVLLVSAIAMVVTSHQYPFVAGWLTAKVLALLCYIALGMIALRFGRTVGERLAAWLAAQVVFAYIVAVAITRNPWPWSAVT